MVLLQETHSTNPHLPSLFLNPIQVEDAKVKDTDAVPYLEVSHLIMGYLITSDLIVLTDLIISSPFLLIPQ